MERKRSPHIQDLTGDLRDYNGTGIWSVEEVRKRYQAHARTYGSDPAQLTPKQRTEGDEAWIYPILDEIIPLIKAGDPAAIEIGIELIEEDDFFVFGKILKSNTARELRRAHLSETQKRRIRRRIVSMMLSGNVPHEFHEYKKLLRKIGVGSLWATLDAGVDRENPHVMGYYDYLHRYARKDSV